MNKAKIISLSKEIIIIFCFIFTIYIIYEHKNINDSYVRETENYDDLKTLNNEILSTYKIDLRTNENLYKWKHDVEYNETMARASRPSTKLSKYYIWILIGLSVALILLDKLTLH